MNSLALFCLKQPPVYEVSDCLQREKMTRDNKLLEMKPTGKGENMALQTI